LSSKIHDAAADGAFAGAAARRASATIAIIALSIAVIVLAVVLILNQISVAQIAPKLADRWTATDQANYEADHQREVEERIAEEKKARAAVIKEHAEEGAHGATAEALARIEQHLKDIDGRLDRIEKKVFNGYKGGG
jgi:predicted Holliday junction resolvase-like endonuclease